MVKFELSNAEACIVSKSLYYYASYLDKLDIEDLHDYINHVMDLAIKFNELQIESLHQEIKNISL